MKAFKELKNDVYEITQTKFGQLTDDVRLRLDLELNAIKQYGRTELLVALWRLFTDLSEKGIGVKLRPLDGYSVSLVSYLLGISSFNPMEHPNLITERYVLNTLREVARVDLRIDVNKPQMIVELVYDYGYEYVRDSILKIYILLRLKLSTKNLQIFHCATNIAQIHADCRERIMTSLQIVSSRYHMTISMYMRT